jgi:hypothetical protein
MLYSDLQSFHLFIYDSESRCRNRLVFETRPEIPRPWVVAAQQPQLNWIGSAGAILNPNIERFLFFNRGSTGVLVFFI